MCSDGQATVTNPSYLGSNYNYPERNCCACGKDSSENDMSIRGQTTTTVTNSNESNSSTPIIGGGDHDNNNFTNPTNGTPVAVNDTPEEESNVQTTPVAVSSTQD